MTMVRDPRGRVVGYQYGAPVFAPHPTENTPSGGLAPASSGYWRPAALDQPSTPYPTPSGASASTGRSGGGYRGSVVDRYIASRNPGGYSGSITPGSATARAGTGSYMGPGTFDMDQQYQANAANAMAGQNPYIMANRRLQASGGGGSGGGSRGTGNALVDEFQSAMDRANQANEARYQDTLGGYQNRYERNMAMLDGYGNQQKEDVNRAYDARGAALRQNVVGRGLGNSSVSDTMQMGNNERRDDEMGRLSDRLTQMRLSADSELSGDVLELMERKQENAPSYDQLAQLSMMLGQAGDGQPSMMGAGQPIFQSPAQVGYQMPVGIGGVAFNGGGNRGNGYNYAAADLYRLARNAAKGRFPAAVDAAKAKRDRDLDWARPFM